MEGISGITARVAGIQSHLDALSVGGTGAPRGGTAGASSPSGPDAFAGALAQQLGTQQPGTQQPGTQQPGTQQPGTAQAAAPQLAVPGATRPAGPPPGTQQLAAQQPGVEQLGAQQLGAQQLGAQQLGAQQLGAQQPGTGAGGLATALAAAPAAPAVEPAFSTTTTTSLSSDGLAQLLAALPGTRAGSPPAATRSAPPLGAVGAAPAATAPATPAPATTAPASPASLAGRLDARGVPLELKAHGNGKVPESQLVEIGGAGSGERLWGPAAAAFDRMAAAARADGVTFRVNDSYRSYEDQVSMAERKGLRSQGGLAAAPGTSSHGWGMAVDLGLDGRAQAWVRENAGRFGFAETVPGEPWHWGFRPAVAA